MKGLKLLIKTLILFPLLISAFTKNLTNNEINSINYLSYYSNGNIIVISGKTNKTKCITTDDIKEDEVLFQYNSTQTISSETCQFAHKKEIVELGHDKYKNDTFTAHKIVLSGYGLYENHQQTNEYLRNIDLSQYKYNEVGWTDETINDYGITGKLSTPSFKENIERMKRFYQLLLINYRNFPEMQKWGNTENELLFGNYFYFVSTHSFVISSASDDSIIDTEIVILPYLDICAITPSNLLITNEYTNTTNTNNILLNNGTVTKDTTEDFNTFYTIKAQHDYYHNDNFYFSFTNSISNHGLLRQEGYIIKDNPYNTYPLSFSISGDSPALTASFIEDLIQNGISEGVYRSEGTVLFFDFDGTSKPMDHTLFIIGFVYKKIIEKKNRKHAPLIQTLTIFSIKFSYDLINDEIKKVLNKMNGVDSYVKDIHEDEAVGYKDKMRNVVHYFNLENLKMLMNHKEFLMMEIVKNTERGINSYKHKYTVL